MLKLTKTVLQRPVAVIVLIAGMLIFGVSSILSMPLKLIPDMQMPMLLVQIIYPQAGPEEVERLVSKEIEEACGTISGLDTITSYSRENVSMVLLQFDYGTNLDESYTDVQSAVNRAKSSMPESIHDPIIMEMMLVHLQQKFFSQNLKRLELLHRLKWQVVIAHTFQLN